MMGSEVDMKRKYCVVLKSESSVRLSAGDEQIYVEGRGAKEINGAFSDLMEKTEEGIEFHRGMQAEIQLEQDSVENAIGEARYIADAFIILAGFTANAKTGLFKPYLAYEVTPEIDERPFKQYLYDIAVVHSDSTRQLLSVEKFSKLSKGLKSFLPQDRFGRSLRWYWKALSEEDDFDRFTNIWIALETINPVLRERFNVELETRACQKCGDKVNIESVVGVRHLITQYLEDKEVYSAVKKLRTGLFHGTEDLTKLCDEARRMIRKLEEAFIKAILLLADVPQDEWNAWLVAPVRGTDTLWLETEGFLMERDYTRLASQGHPRFEIKPVLVEAANENDGTVKHQAKVSFEWKAKYPFKLVSALIKGPTAGVSADAYLRDPAGRNIFLGTFKSNQ